MDVCSGVVTRASVLALSAALLLMPTRVPAQTSTAAGVRADTALARLVANASEKNRLPSDLIAYKANAQTEVELVVRHADGTETVGSIEQLASTLRWTRAGMYDQHVTGFRSQQAGLSFSMLFLQTGWLNPVLYGNRLRALSRWSEDAALHDSASRVGRTNRKPSNSVARPATAKEERERAARAIDTIAVIHPLAADRNRYYVYSRGDTLVTLQAGDRRIPIVRVHVEPRADLKDSVAIFIGDIDLDVSRGTLVRMRGYFARAGVARRHGMLLAVANAIAFIEFENAEVNGTYWLPAVQRIELQVVSPILGEARAVMRIVTRFPTIAVNDTVLDAVTLAAADSMRAAAHRRIAFASNDSLSKFANWQYPFGSITAGLHADDFNDIGPDRFRPTGAPRFDIAADRLSDVVRFNRVEGWYTGLGGKLALRDLAPGVTLRGSAGWAWSEKTARVRVSIEKRSGNWDVGLRAGRSLDITNDFRAITDSGSSLGALGTDDPYDYADRRSAAVSVGRFLLGKQVLLRGDFGVADDRYAATTRVRGLYGNGKFLPNRGVDEGGYRRTAAVVEWHPNTDATVFRSSFTSRLLYERGDGTLTYQRAEIRAVSVGLAGPFTLRTNAYAGQLFGRDLPPQQLFELGEGQNLPGYANKEFAGSRAAVLRSTLMYTSHLLPQRIHITRNYWIPSISPGASIGLQSGWADAPGDAARASVLRLGLIADSTGVLRPVSRVTGNIRATAAVGLRFFSGNVFVGVARAVDRPGPWKLQWSLGSTL
ncbi:MAG: hypothetical protein M3Y64_05615 [Gemmatimonadota bacterium]|nr:hypothetical protein [Gemmatimonadota bacterium]